VAAKSKLAQPSRYVLEQREALSRFLFIRARARDRQQHCR
jgi:hypothetical protein